MMWVFSAHGGIAMRAVSPLPAHPAHMLVHVAARSDAHRYQTAVLRAIKTFPDCRAARKGDVLPIGAIVSEWLQQYEQELGEPITVQ